MKIKLIMTVFLIAVLGAWLSIGGSARQADDPGVLLRAAIEKEEVDGDLQGAIDLYKEIIAKYGANRAIAAKAQLHIGLCYEKLGLKEAQKAFQKVVDDFPEQKEVVRIAKEKLSIITKTRALIEKGDKEFKIRQIWAGALVDTTGAPSPDGRYLSFVDWETGDLAIRELASGEKRRLTNKGSWFKSVEFAIFSRWSPDGKKVVYSWLNKDGFFELRIIALDGSEPRVLYQDEKVRCVLPYDWSSDGKHILAGFGRAFDEPPNQIGLVSVLDGSSRILKVINISFSSVFLFSPDGRFIAYDRPPQEDSPGKDIFLLSTDESREIPLVEHPADDSVLGWAPDGKSILFASDRRGTVDAWIINVAEGKVQGDPKLIKKDVGEIGPMGITKKCSFYYSLETKMIDVYIATLDLEKGKLLTPPKKATQRFVGSNSRPEWSPDGKYLAYISERWIKPGKPNTIVLCIRSVETGEERELYPELKDVWGLWYSPDGRSILTAGRDKKRRSGIYMINVKTGDMSTIIQVEPGEHIFSLVWLPNGRAIVYKRYNRGKKSVSIFIRDMETARERRLYHSDNSSETHHLALSPDGKWLAFNEFKWWDSAFNEKSLSNERLPTRFLKVMSISGGESLDVLRTSEQGNAIKLLEWTPDSREILFGKASFKNNREWKIELWRILAEGGKAQRIDLAMANLDSVRFHPDGRRIAFSAGPQSFEVWVMENFLPEIKINNEK